MLTGTKFCRVSKVYVNCVMSIHIFSGLSCASLQYINKNASHRKQIDRSRVQSILGCTFCWSYLSYSVARLDPVNCRTVIDAAPTPWVTPSQWARTPPHFYGAPRPMFFCKSLAIPKSVVSPAVSYVCHKRFFVNRAPGLVYGPHTRFVQFLTLSHPIKDSLSTLRLLLGSGPKLLTIVY